MSLPSKICDRAKEVYKQATRSQLTPDTQRHPWVHTVPPVHNAGHWPHVHVAAQIEEKQSLRGRSREAIIAATLYIACRYNDVPRTLKGEPCPPPQSRREELC